MEFLNKLVIPLSGEHIALLHYLQMLILFLFIPFISIVFGGLLLSIIYRNKGAKENNSQYLRFSRELIEITTVNKSTGVILGIFPVLTSILLMVQILHGSSQETIALLSYSFIVIILALILVYAYRYTLTLSEIFTAIKDIKIEDLGISGSVKKYRERSWNLSIKTGVLGFILLFLAVWLFIAGLTVTTFHSAFADKTLISILFGWQVISRLIYFIFAAFAFTGATAFFIYFYWEGGREGLSKDYENFIRNLITKVTFISALFIPIFLVIDLFGLPGNTLSGSVYTFSFLALVFLFFVYHFIYSMLKFENAKFSGHLFLAMLLILMTVIVKDQIAMNNATKLQSEMLTNQFDSMMLKISATQKPKVINGKEIYQNICSACHSFDHKVVGPPYEQTMPKYEGKMDQLVAFILNPKQNNPGYPPMPNPGLKPDQAKAVANYIMDTYLKDYKGK